MNILLYEYITTGDDRFQKFGVQERDTHYVPPIFRSPEPLRGGGRKTRGFHPIFVTVCYPLFSILKQIVLIVKPKTEI